ncbi:glycogen/starch/alpha-glucan phosphorylase [Trichothermofontia sp.]
MISLFSKPEKPKLQIEDDRTGLEVDTLRRAMADHLFYNQGKFTDIATKNDYYMALAYTVRDRLLRRWLNTNQTYLEQDVKVVAYLSAEFLLGPHLGNNLLNLGIYDQVRQAVTESGLDLDELLAQEEEPGLGNGGLGRLAACYMESLATLEIPAIGYGTRYEFGIFDQEISMNGALTIGTLDGANIEIREEAGAENFFLFGLTAQEVCDLLERGYHPWDYYQGNGQLKALLDLLAGGYFSHGDTQLFRPLIDSLLYHDPFLLLADYQSYVDCQEKVSQAYRDQEQWTRMSILNTARMGKFSSDRAIREYCEDIWHVQPTPITLKAYVQADAGLRV